ncbi:hypothetical protein ACIRYZ_45280 [Kitasatospora sp. NPDC101155]|uniref:hypothetical protein n=1 Tax=Kitasatospora sp. NPDC101155 TaxID=3364097 RepID=UPI0037F8C34C
MRDRLGTTRPTDAVTARHPALGAALRLWLTTVYIVLLTVTASWLANQSHTARARFVRHNSSNVHHMEVETLAYACCCL